MVFAGIDTYDIYISDIDKKNLYIENTMLISFDIKFLRQDQRQYRNGEACHTSPVCFWSSLINFISKYSNMVFYLSCVSTRL